MHADGPNKGMALVRRTLQLAEPVPADELRGDLERLSVTDNGAAVPAITPITTASVSASNEPQHESPEQEPEPESPVTDEDDEDPEHEPQAPAIEEDPHTRVAAVHVFAVGDAADAFGAVNAGHNAFFQGEVAARNVVRLVKAAERAAAAESDAEGKGGDGEEEEEDLTLEKYNPGPPAIKVSLGLVSVPRVSPCPSPSAQAHEQRY